MKERLLMTMLMAKPVAPSKDKRWKIVEATARRHGNARHALIETLHSVQEAFGFLDEDALRYVANLLQLPMSKVYGVATFYHFFTLRPPGKHTCVVCMGTACYIKGAGELISAVEQNYGIKPGQTTADGNLSLLTARCVGSCGLAPAVVFDGEVAGKVTSSDLINRLGKWDEK
jgi:bidirectional [NiFe] hydrogenase diaphorase subunit